MQSVVYLHSLIWFPVQINFPPLQELKYIEQAMSTKKRNIFSFLFSVILTAVAQFLGKEKTIWESGLKTLKPQN